jgi:hypothetical protein
MLLTNRGCYLEGILVRYRMPPSVRVVRAGVTCGLLPNCCGRGSFWVG